MRKLLDEFDGVDFGDLRLTKRLAAMVQSLAQRPGVSFPAMFPSERELEGSYRFMNNPAVSYEGIAAPHRERTVERAAEERLVIVVHDTTSFQFAHADPKEVGFLQTGKPGFYGHFSLAVSGDGERRPLGIVNLETTFRKQRSRGHSRHRPGSTTATQANRESKRWEDGVRTSEAVLGGAPDVIHVGDREADSYSLLGLMRQNDWRFVFRVRHDRVARKPSTRDDDAWPSTLKTLTAKAKDCVRREVTLSVRRTSTAPRQAKAFPARDTRTAQLHFAATTVVIRKPRYLRDRPETAELNIVRVYEKRAPKGQEPVEWLLATTEPIATPQDVVAIVDIYRARWLIEEFFKALKSGCIYEDRQLESRHALLNALAIFSPVACQLLWLRARARIPAAPATDVLTKAQLKILAAIATRPVPKNATSAEALSAIAGLGGHIKNNGPPGWAVLRRGLERLLLAEIGWDAAQKM